MKSGLVPGLSAEITARVTPEMCPHFDGMMKHPVCATWTIVNLMEVAGRKLLEPFLDEQEEGVGAHITVDHRAPAPIGTSLRVRAEVESATHRRLTARVVALHGEVHVAEGRFVQIILPKNHLREILGDAPGAG